MNHNTVLSRRWLAGVALLLASAAAGQEHIGSTSQPLISGTTVKLWTEAGNKVPVCWESTGFAREKKLMKDAVINTWEYYSRIQFTGWETCPMSGEAKHVRVRILPHATGANDGADGSAAVGMAALSKAADNNPGMVLYLNANGTAVRGRVEYLAVHEFGHVLGFEHEQDAEDNEGPAKCNTGLDPDVDPQAITPYDRDSVMNYCNRDGNNTGNLTDVDILGVQKTYGVRFPNVPPPNSCASAPLKLRASLAAAWNDLGQTSVAMFTSAGPTFQAAAHWSVKQGGWGDKVKFASGDFNGDRKTDIAAAWNNGGKTTLTVRLSTGNGFVVQHWLNDAGGWADNTVLMAGDFDNDEYTDLASAWNDGNATSVAVWKSAGRSFLPPEQWAVRDGGWHDSVKWAAGDFNGDGKTDLAAAWNNDGRTAIAVRASTGRKFNVTQWNTNAGSWYESSVFVAGFFNNDDRADLAQVWNDVGNHSTKMNLSTGSAFNPPVAWSDRDGGWTPAVKFTPGDFNGDGYTDIAASWNDRAQNTLSVRASDSSKFNTAHWSIGNGGWIDSTAWCAGSFN